MSTKQRDLRIAKDQLQRTTEHRQFPVGVLSMVVFSSIKSASLLIIALSMLVLHRVAGRRQSFLLSSFSTFSTKGQSIGFPSQNNATLSLPQTFDGDKLTRKIGEEVVFSGYRKIVRRDVMLPNGHIANFDIVHQKHLSVVVFVWDTTSATGTLIREYHPGPERFLYGTVAGMCEDGKHNSALEAAKFELEEEAQLQTDRWYPLLEEAGTMMPLDKYSNNNFLPFMALDCQPVLNPRALDDEEFISVHHNVSYDQMMDLMQKGNMNVVSTFTVMLGFQKLIELGIPLKPSH